MQGINIRKKHAKRQTEISRRWNIGNGNAISYFQCQHYAMRMESLLKLK